MELYWKSIAGILLAAILGTAISRKDKEMAAVLHMITCAMAAIIALQYLNPILEFLRNLETAGSLPEGTLGILLKIMGIGILSQITAALCSDCGSTSLGRCLNILCGAAILYLATPMFYMLLDILQEILGEV